MSLIRFKLAILAVIVLMVVLIVFGCAAKGAVDVQPKFDIRPDTNIGPEITTGSDNITAGRTAVSVSPTVYIAGSTIVALAAITMLIAALVTWGVRQQAIIKAVVLGVERAENAGISTKHAIRQQAEQGGVENNLHRLVKKLTE